jgi:hypothetical protein
MRAYGELSETAVGREIEQRVRKCRYGLDVFVWNALLGSWRRRAGCFIECLRGMLSAGRLEHHGDHVLVVRDL